MPTFYLDYENGSDAASGADWANAWKTITAGPTAARIAPGDIIRIAKSGAPSSIGNATWNNLSKTVTLASAQTLNIDLCETAWTAIGGGDCTVTRTAVATDGKEGSYCMKLAMDAAPQANVGQAFFATGELNLSAYQKISFWIKNEAAIADATTWVVNLCSDVAGATPVDSFVIPAIPSTARWIPLTLTKVGGGNLGASIKSIAIYTGATAPTASKYIYVDDFIACTTAGLNLQSLISKNSLEQGGTEGWYGIQSINNGTILLDNDTNTKANVGRGYFGTTELVATYKRETIKTALASTSATGVQEVQDIGTLAGGNIQFQGGWNTSTTEQDGETFFDGLNGNGYGLYLSSKSYTTFNYLNACRYNHGFYSLSGYLNIITNLNNSNNNTVDGLRFYASNNLIIVNIGNANNNTGYGINFTNGSSNNSIFFIGNVNNNLGTYGISLDTKIIIKDMGNAANNGSNGVGFNGSNSKISNVITSNNVTRGVYASSGNVGFLLNATINEATKADGAQFCDARIFSHKHDQTANNHWIFTDGGTINSLATDRVGGTGIMWKLVITSSNRASNYPLYLSIAKIAVTADNLVTVKVYMKKDHATNVVGKLVCRGGQLTGVASDVTATKADDTDWEELTITFTPTEAGVIEIEAWAYYSAGNSNVYVEDMTITQA